MDVQAFSPGIYPRSEALVQATRDLDRGRTTPDAVDEQVQRDVDQLVRVQQEAGLDLLADGMLRWQDLFRPLVEGTDRLAAGPLTRFLDTNSFYRAPEGDGGEPSLRTPLDGRYLPPLPGPRLVTLPSPFALSRSTGLSPEALARGVLRPQIDSLGDGVELVVLSEPFLATEKDGRVSALAGALEVLAGGPRLALQLTFADAGPLLARGLAELPVDGIGVDFLRTRLEDVPEGLDKLLLAGVVDGRNSALEEPRSLARFAARLRERGVLEVALVPNGDLQYVSEPIARKKLALLGAAKKEAEGA